MSIPTYEQVHAALRDLAAVSSRAEANRLCEKVGGSQLSELDEPKYAAVIEAAKAATERAKATKQRASASVSGERRSIADLDVRSIYGRWNNDFVKGTGRAFTPEEKQS